MASYGDTGIVGSSGPEIQEEKKTSTVSFGFTKTVNKFKSSTDTATKKEEKDYLTGIDQKELQR